MNQITHVTDPDTGHLVQIVSPRELIAILRKAGESLQRPKDFAPQDEWDTED